jgi:hypothetical protein
MNELSVDDFAFLLTHEDDTQRDARLKMIDIRIRGWNWTVTMLTDHPGIFNEGICVATMEEEMNYLRTLDVPNDMHERLLELADSVMSSVNRGVQINADSEFLNHL